MTASPDIGAGVDGCTVFDGDLRLLGYGVKIREKPRIKERPLKQFWGRMFLMNQEYEPTGMRHLPAFRLCLAVEEIVCAASSQDGPVSLLWSKRDEVLWCAPYYPWMNKSDHV